MFLEIFWLLALASFSLLLLSSFLVTRTSTVQSLLAGYGKNLPRSLVVAAPWFFYLPKSYFTLFYVIGSSWSVILLASCLSQCTASVPVIPPTWGALVLDVCRWLANPPTPGLPQAVMSFPAHMTSSDCLLGLAMLVVQTVRRLYEQLFIFRTSPSAKIPLLLFTYGMVFYILIAVTIVYGSPFLRGTPLLCWSVSTVSWCRYGVSVGVFAWASRHQHKCHSILASLRQPGQMAYAMPSGDWFTLVSSPHYLAELIIYISIGVVVAGDYLWCVVFGVVFTSLAFPALETHQFYRTKFPEYPRDRKAVLPWVL